MNYDAQGMAANDCRLRARSVGCIITMMMCENRVQVLMSVCCV